MTKSQDKNSIVPFGKYKGEEIEAIAIRDPAYIQWLGQQAWFEEKFHHLAETLLAGFKSPSQDTPEHNAMQIQFADEQFCWKFCQAATKIGPPLIVERGMSSIFEIQDFLKTITPGKMEVPREFLDLAGYEERTSRINGIGDYYRSRIEEMKAIKQKYEERFPFAVAEARDKRALRIKLGISDLVFEQGTDVVFVAQGWWPVLEGWKYADEKDRFGRGLQNWKFHFGTNGYFKKFAVECKPFVGDDYPAILRQINKQRRSQFSPSNAAWYLMIRDFKSKSIGREQLAAFFRQSNIGIIFEKDVLSMDVSYDSPDPQKITSEEN